MGDSPRRQRDSPRRQRRLTWDHQVCLKESANLTRLQIGKLETQSPKSHCYDRTVICGIHRWCVNFENLEYIPFHRSLLEVPLALMPLVVPWNSVIHDVVIHSTHVVIIQRILVLYKYVTHRSPVLHKLNRENLHIFLLCWKYIVNNNS